MNRYRTRGGLLPATNLVYHYTAWSSGGIYYPNQADGVSLKTGRVETMTDVVTPKFAAKSGKGEIISNPMDQRDFEFIAMEGDGPITASVATFGSPPKSNTWERPGRSFEKIVAQLGQTNLLVHPSTSDLSIEDMVTEVSTKVLADIGTEDSNSFESLAEIGQTIELLKSPISGLSKMISNIQREARRADHKINIPRFESEFQMAKRLGRVSPGFSLKNAIEAVKTAADRSSGLWLSYRYGLLPFISDINMIMASFSKVTGPVRRTHRSNLTDSSSSYTTSLVTAAWVPALVDVGIQKTDFVKVRAYALEEYIADLANSLGFTTKGLVRTPYDLIPLSFVQDWFTNVADYVMAFAPAPGYKVLASGLTIDRTSSILYTPISTVILPSQASTYKITRQFSGSYSVRARTKTRVPLSAPGIVVKHSFKFDKFTRQADAVALIQQQMGRVFGHSHGPKVRFG